MKHIRAQIREHVQLLLQGRAPFNVVSRSRTASIAHDELPAARILLTDEEAEPLAQGTTPLYQRNSELAVELLAREVAGEAFDDVLDEMALVAEQAMTEDTTLGGLVKRMRYTGIFSDYSDEQPEGQVVMTWQITYHTRMNEPETAR